MISVVKARFFALVNSGVELETTAEYCQLGWANNGTGMVDWGITPNGALNRTNYNAQLRAAKCFQDGAKLMWKGYELASTTSPQRIPALAQCLLFVGLGTGYLDGASGSDELYRTQ